MVSDDEKLALLAEIEGYKTPLAMCQDRVTDSAFPGICMNPGCDYTTDVEGDQDAGWCESCDTGTVKSGLLLAGLI